ncbi:MAG: hypothetical protein KAX25_01300 [Dehalococcoidia bacterium]|nr:hypothetical protein [Dehalococcoidia bacterium]
MQAEERDPAHLWDMLEAGKAIVDFTEELTLEEFLAAGRDMEITRLAVERELEILGEAAEGFDASGRSYVCHRLESRGDKVKIPLVEHGDKVRMTPPGLNESEAQFVQDMRDY